MRAQFRERRRQLSEDSRDQAAQSACLHLINHSLFKNSHSIACYLPTRYEFNAVPLIEAIWDTGKKCYLPVLTSNESLEFAFYDVETSLIPNEFKILEPQDKSRMLSPEKLDLVLMPLVAFDLQGHRLGTGGGYYDRTFATVEMKPKLIGLAFDVQRAENLPSDSWDVGLDGVVTESGVVLF